MMGQGSDSCQAGLVESLARPAATSPEYTPFQRASGNRLELLQEAVPSCPCRVSLRSVQFASVREVKEVLPVPARALRLLFSRGSTWCGRFTKKVFAALDKQRPDDSTARRGPLMRANEKQTIASR